MKDLYNTIKSLSLAFFCLFLSAGAMAQITSASNGDWHVGSTWVGGVAPGPNDNVIIAHTVWINTATGNVTRNAGTNTLVQPSGSLQTNTIYTNNGTTTIQGEFQINPGGYATGNNFDYQNTGTLSFNALPYIVNVGDVYWPAAANRPYNVLVKPNPGAALASTHTVTVTGSRTVNGLLETYAGIVSTAGTTITIDNMLRITGVGYMRGQDVQYIAPATLEYATGGNYDRNSEWPANAANTPTQVNIVGNTVLNMWGNGGSTNPRTVKGNLTITTGGKLLMSDNTTSTTTNLSVPLTIEGNVTVNNGTLRLSKFMYGDIKIGGDINFNTGYVFEPNKGAVILTRNGTQNLNCAGDVIFSYLAFQVPAPGNSSFVLNCPRLRVDAPDGGGVIDWDLSGTNNGGNIIDINGKILALGKDAGSAALNTYFAHDGWFKGSTTSELHAYAPGDLGILKFVAGFEKLHRLRIYKGYRQQAATLGSDLWIYGPAVTTGQGSDNLQFGENAGANQGGILALANFNMYIAMDATNSVPLPYISPAGGWVNTNGTGEVRQLVSTGVNPYTIFKIPTGDATLFAGSAISFPSILNTYSAGAYAGFRTVGTKHPLVEAPTHYLKRYYPMTMSGISLTANGSANPGASIQNYYNDADIAGTESVLEQGTWQPDFSRWWNIKLINNSFYQYNYNFLDINVNAAIPAGVTWDNTAAKPLKYQEIVVKENNNNGPEYQTGDNYTFTNASPGNTNTVTFYITNIGTENLNISSITVTGAGYSIQSISKPLPTNIVHNNRTVPSTDVLASTGLKVTVALSPTAMGSHPGQLKIFNDDPDDNEAPFIINFVADAKTLPTDFFRTVSTGNWTTPTIWESAKTATGTWYPATVSPTYQAGGTFLRAGHIVTINTTGVSIGKAEVQSGSTLLVNNTDFQLGNTTGAVNTQLTIMEDGKMIVDGAVTPFTGLGRGLVKAGGLLQTTATLTNGDNFAGNFVKGATFKWQWEDQSILEWNSSLEFLGSTGISQFFEMTPSQTGFVIFRVNAFPSGGSFSSSTATSINARIDLNVPAFKIEGNTKSIKGGITGNSVIEHPTGAITFLNGAVIGSAGDVLVFNTFNNGIAFSNGPSSVEVPVNATVRIASAPANNDIKLGSTASTLNINGTLDITDMQIVASTGMVSVNSTGRLTTASAYNLYGSSATTGAIYSSSTSQLTLAAGSTVEYNRLGDQPIQAKPAGQTYYNLILSGSGNKTAPDVASGPLEILGNLSKTGSATFVHNGGKVLFSGTGSQLYSSPNTDLPYFTFNDVDITNTTGLMVGSTPADSMAVAGKLSLLSNGKINLNNSTIHLLSNATGTARVGVIAGSSAITYTGSGQFSVQRFMPTKRKWQLLAIPTNNTSATTAKANWQENETATMNKPGWGVRLTDSLSTAISNGFDAVTTGPSVKYYDNGISGYKGIPNTTAYDLSQNPTSGYFLFHYGDRSAALNANTTLRTWGKIYTGMQSSPAIAANNQLIVGNPYASPVDMRNVTFAGSNILTYYIWDPKLTGVWGAGGFQTLSRSNGTADFTINPGGGSYGASNSVQNFIQSGQAIFVKNVTASASPVVFNETDKVDFYINAFRIGNGSTLVANIYLKDTDTSSTLLDGVMVKLNDQYKNAVDELDSRKLLSQDYYLALTKGNEMLSVDRRPEFTSGDTVHLSLGRLSAGKYYFDLYTFEYFSNGLSAFVVDEYTRTKTLIDLQAGDKYGFEIADEASKNSARLYIVFEGKPASLITPDPDFVIMPNPVVNNLLQIRAGNIALGTYKATVINMQGQKLMNFGFEITAASQVIRQQLPPLPAGSYVLTATGSDAKPITRRFVLAY